MMKQLTPQDIINQYVEFCEIERKCTLNGDYKTSNKHGKRMLKVFKELEKDKNLAIELLPKLFNHQNVVARTDAAAHCLSLNICVKEAIECLEKIEKYEAENIFGFNAKMTLKVWREQGFLKMYPKQESNKNIGR